MKSYRKMPLYIKVFIFLVAGGVLGFIFGEKVAPLAPIGDAYIRLLKMLVVPLVFFSIMSGVAKLSSPKEFGIVGSRIIGFYLVTTTAAAALGVVVATVLNPGVGAEGLLGVAKEVSYQEYNVAETILSWIPENIVASMAKMDMLPVIIFSILFGLCMVLAGEKAKHVSAFIESANEVMLEMTNLVTSLAPYGIFFLAMQLTGTLGNKMLEVAVRFVGAGYVAIAILLVIVYPILLKFMGRLSPFKFYGNVIPALLMAVSTTSSNAALPMSFQCSGQKCGVPEKIYGFSLPLGATMNMNGFAALLGIISITALELYNVEVTPLLVLQAVGMGLVLSVGAPGVQGTAVVMSAVLFEALGLPMGMLPLIAAIWPVVNLASVTANVAGDHVGTCIVAAKLGMLDREVFDGKKRSAEQ